MKISCVIPVWNMRQEFFNEAVESVINQTRKPDEIIIVDDGSEPALSYDFPDTKGIKFKHIKNEKNMGIGFSRQRGVEESTGDYICFLSGDDMWEPTYLETMLRESEKHPGKILYSKYYVINEKGDITGGVDAQGFNNHEDFCVACFDWAYRNNMFVNTNTTFFPKEVFKKVGFKYEFGEDLYFLLASMKYFEYHLVPEYLLKYRAWEGNLTSRVRTKIVENNDKIIKDVLEFWKNE